MDYIKNKQEKKLLIGTDRGVILTMDISEWCNDSDEEESAYSPDKLSKTYQSLKYENSSPIKSRDSSAEK
jgi:hypothetical protein